MNQYTIVECNFEDHAHAILDIFNDAIRNSTALYDYKSRTIDNMASWFQTKKQNGFPVIGMIDQARTLVGFASYGTFRAWPAYKYSVEHSVYVHQDYRGQGIAIELMKALINTAQMNDVHTMIGGIDATNVSSIRLHEKLGFIHAGTLPQVGFKFGRWLDLAFYQILLRTPEQPVDG